MNNIEDGFKNFPILEFRRIFLLANVFIDSWDAGRNGLHSCLGSAYLGKRKNASGHSMSQFWKISISKLLNQKQSTHEIARLINNDFICLVGASDFDSISRTYADDINCRQPIGEGALEPNEFRERLYGHYINYLQDCITHCINKNYRDHSRLVEYLFHPNPLVGESVRSREVGALTHKEHVVPLRCINNLVIDGMKNEKSIREIRIFLENSLKIIRIHKEEQKLIDGQWKDCMPTGWAIGGSVFDRLEKSGIKFELYKSAS